LVLELGAAAEPGRLQTLVIAAADVVDEVSDGVIGRPQGILSFRIPFWPAKESWNPFLQSTSLVSSVFYGTALAGKSRERVGKEAGKLLALCRDIPSRPSPNSPRPFGIAELEQIRKILNRWRAEGHLEILGRGRDARWRTLR